MSFSERLEKVLSLRDALRQRRDAFVTKAVGGYGYSGWIWETVGGEFRLKQGPKLLSLETSC